VTDRISALLIDPDDDASSVGSDGSNDTIKGINPSTETAREAVKRVWSEKNPGLKVLHDRMSETLTKSK